MEKKNGPSEVDVLQQVIVELRTEISVLKEQLEEEKKVSSDLKSLKTQQVSTLTSKLANTVRQREQAEEELAKVKKEMEELKENLKVQAEEIQVEENQHEIDAYSKLENSTEQCLVEETSEVNKQDNSAEAIDKDIVSSWLEKDESDQDEGFLANRKSSLQLESKSDVLSSEDSFQSCFPEYSPKEELCQSVSLIEVSEASLSSCSELGNDFSKENSSIQEKTEGLFDQKDLLISSPEIYDTSLISLSLESLEENPKEITEALQGSKKVQEDLCKVQESPLTVPKAVDVKNVPERRQQISEKPYSSSTLKNKRIRSQSSEEDQESSPPTSSEAVSSGYTSNSTEEKLENLLMDHGMADDHNAAMFPGNAWNDVKEQEVHPKGFLNEDKKDDVTKGTNREQDKKGLDDFMKREQAPGTVLKENCKSSSFKNTENKAEKGVKKRIEGQNDYLPQTISEEVFDLKQQLKNALKEIDELRLENKEMKKEIQNLSSTSAEEEFLLKTTRFTDRLLREMREREARVYVPRSFSTLEKYGLEREHGYPGLTELSQMRVTRDMNRSAARKTSFPLKVIGAKLKELTRSVENMATDPGLCEESLPDLSTPDDVGFKQNFPSLNDHFELEESLLMPTVSSDTLSAQNAPFKHEKPGDVPTSGSYTSLEKLSKERFLAATKNQLQFTSEKDLARDQPRQSENQAQKDCPWRDNRCQLAERQTQERSGFESLCDKQWKLHSDTRDYVERYIVRSSDHIAKMRDLTPEEIAFYSKLA